MYMAMRSFLLLVLLLSLALAGCRPGHALRSPSKALPDGIYLLLGTYPDSLAAANGGGRVIPMSARFADEESGDSASFIAVDPRGYVPLTLASPPDSVRQPDARIHLMLTLSPKAKQRLARFTERHLQEMISVVIGGEGVTQHRIKSRIDGGRLQITRCTDHACEYLYFELQDNVGR